MEMDMLPCELCRSDVQHRHFRTNHYHSLPSLPIGLQHEPIFETDSLYYKYVLVP